MLYIPFPFKYCSQCTRRLLATTENFRFRKCRHSLHSWCRECERRKARDHQRDYQKRHPDRAKANRLAWYYSHREHANAVNAQWIKAHREQRREAVLRNSARSRRKNIETVRKHVQLRRAKRRCLPAELTVKQIKLARAYFNGCCAVCGRAPDFWHTIALDHWIPLSSPHCPGTTAANTLPLCHSTKGVLGNDSGCNNSKSGSDPEEWLIAKFGSRKAKIVLKRIQNYFEWIKAQDE